MYKSKPTVSKQLPKELGKSWLTLQDKDIDIYNIYYNNMGVIGG